MFNFGKDNKFVLFFLVVVLILYVGPKHVIQKSSKRKWLSIPVIAGVAILLLLGITLYQQYHIDVPQPQRVEHSI